MYQYFLYLLLSLYGLIDRRISKNELIDTRRTIIDHIKLRKLSIYMILCMLIIFVVLSLLTVWGTDLDDELVTKIFGSMVF